MAISLTPADKKLIQERMKSGLFKSVEEVIHDALASQDSEAEWLIDNKVAINKKIARGVAQLDRGEGVSGDVARAFSVGKRIGRPGASADEQFSFSRQSGRPLNLTFQGTLRPEQKAAADSMLKHDTGVLAATTAFGKTVVAAWLIAQRGVNTLVLVHRRQLLDQWVERLSTFLNINNREIGKVGGGRRKPTGRLDVAVIQSLVRKGVVEDYVGEYGHVVVDECHHLSAHSFEQVVRRAKAKFVTGLSATVTRKDGHHPIIFMQCGPIRHRVSAKAEAIRRPFTHAVLVRPTAFQPTMPAASDKRVEFHSLYGDLIGDQSRNRRICDDVIEAVQSGRSPLMLTERNDHLDSLALQLTGRVRHVIVLRGGMGKKQREALVAEHARPYSLAVRTPCHFGAG